MSIPSEFPPLEEPSAPVPDPLEEILDSDLMIAVHETERLLRIDRYRRDVLADARRSGVVMRDVVERSIRLELAAAMHATEYTAGVLMIRAEALVHRYPGMLDLLGQGRVTVTHADALQRQFDGVSPELREQLIDQALALAVAHPAGVFRAKLKALIDIATAATLTQRYESAVQGRKVLIEDGPDGMGWLHLHAPLVEIHAIHQRATATARALIAADRADPAGRRDDAADGTADQPADGCAPADAAVRTLDQARADVLCDLLIDGRAPSHPKAARGIRATVVVTVPALSLLDDGCAASAEPALLDGVGPIPIAQARQLCGGSKDWMRVLTHPETGAVLSVGRKRYRPPASLRKLVRWRAARCMAPGCRIPAERCDIDHQEDWACGGQTALTNLAPLCKGHHVVKHHGGWTVRHLPGGVIEWTSPARRVYLVEPERRVPVFTTDAEPAPF